MSIDAPDWSTIPAPQDDGAVRHLAGAKLPLVLLVATDGSTVDLLNLRGRTVVYAYRRTGRPGIQYEPVESQIVADDSCGDAIRALQSCIEMEARARYFIENGTSKIRSIDSNEVGRTQTYGVPAKKRER